MYGAEPVTARPRLLAVLIVVAFAALAALALPGADTAHARGLSGLDRGERKLVREINRVRRAHGLHGLHRNRRLQRSADYHCWDMLRANFFSHSSSNGTAMAARVSRFRPSNRIGENLAYLPSGQQRGVARRVVSMWLNSPGHRAMLLSPTFRRVGVARRRGALGSMRVMVFTVDFASAR